MLNIFLNILGIILVIFSFIAISRKSDRKSLDVDQHIDPKEFLDEVNNFSQILEEKEELEEKKAMYDLNDDRNRINKDIYSPSTINSRRKDIENPTYTGLVKDISDSRRDGRLSPMAREIIDLKDRGLTKEEIARKTNRSVREIEVLLKINKKY